MGVYHVPGALVYSCVSGDLVVCATYLVNTGGLSAVLQCKSGRVFQGIIFQTMPQVGGFSGVWVHPHP